MTFTGSVETGKDRLQGRRREAHPGHAGAWRQEPDDRDGRCRPRQGGRRRDHRHALHAPGPELHRGVAASSCRRRSTIAFVERLRARVDAMKMGDPLDEATDIGTIISPQQFDKVKSYIAIGEATPGAKAIRCSALPNDRSSAKGYFVQPVIFTGVDQRFTARARGDIRSGHLRHQVQELRRRDRAGERQRIRARGDDLDDQSQDRARRDASARSRARPGQSEPRRDRPTCQLRRRQEFRPRQRSDARSDARAFHAQEDDHREHAIRPACRADTRPACVLFAARACCNRPRRISSNRTNPSARCARPSRWSGLKAGHETGHDDDSQDLHRPQRATLRWIGTQQRRGARGAGNIAWP